jgi:hypothetical protein
MRRGANWGGTMHKVQTQKPVGAMLVAGIMAGVLSSGVAMGAPRQPLIARPVTPPYDWSGWRGGVYVGGGWNNGSQWTNPDDGDLGALSTSGVVSLFTLSYAWQSGNVVVAVEGGGGPTDVRGNFESHNWNFSGQLKGLETVRGKLGVATGASGNVLWYGTVGAAWAQYKFGSIWPETKFRLFRVVKLERMDRRCRR